ncbi:hypothetical protein BH09PSE3_BH09PSE3_00010 [soil metagenome]
MTNDQLGVRGQRAPFGQPAENPHVLGDLTSGIIADVCPSISAPLVKRGPLGKLNASRSQVSFSGDVGFRNLPAISRVEPTKIFAGIQFNEQAIGEVLTMLWDRPSDAPFAYAVTPNADHVVRLHDATDVYRDRFYTAYSSAEWKLCDSRVLALLAKLRKRELSVVAGSDLTARLFAEVIAAGDTICVIGGNTTIEGKLRLWFPNLNFVFHRPPLGLRDNQVALAEAADFIVAAKARFTFIGVGSPQQEILAELVFSRNNATGIGLCVGAALEFLTGYSRRAPYWMQQAGLEWCHRLLSDPKRLWRRYLVEGPRVFRIALSDKYSRERMKVLRNKQSD